MQLNEIYVVYDQERPRSILSAGILFAQAQIFLWSAERASFVAGFLSSHFQAPSSAFLPFPPSLFLFY